MGSSEGGGEEADRKKVRIGEAPGEAVFSFANGADDNPSRYISAIRRC